MWSRAREVANGKGPAPFLIQEDEPQVDRNPDWYDENAHWGEAPLTDGLSTEPNPPPLPPKRNAKFARWTPERTGREPSGLARHVSSSANSSLGAKRREICHSWSRLRKSALGNISTWAPELRRYSERRKSKKSRKRPAVS